MTVKEFSAIFQRFMLLRIHQNTGDPCVMLFLVLKRVDAPKFTEVNSTVEILVNANSLSQGRNSELRISQGPSLLTSCCGLLEIRQSLRHTSPKNVSDRLGLHTALLYFSNVLRIEFFVSHYHLKYNSSPRLNIHSVQIWGLNRHESLGG